MRPSDRSQPWTFDSPPERILAIRLHAMGDCVIPLPYLQELRRHLPRARLDFLTRHETREIPSSIDLFDRVYAFGGGRNFKRQCFHAVAMLPRLLWRGYDVVIDLQNNEISRMVRSALRPAAWSEFDRTSPTAAGQRTAEAIRALGLGVPGQPSSLTVKDSTLGIRQLEDAGWDGRSRLVVLNPAGFWATRNWPMENYVEFADYWTRNRPGPTQFLVLGLDALAQKAQYLREQIGPSLLDLTGRTTVSEAFSILQRVTFVLSEDSGLMHMAWVSGIPTLAIFGSTRTDWSRPLGEHTAYLHSGDLPCGPCMEPTCLHGDLRCLTRYSARHVFDLAEELLTTVNSDSNSDALDC